MEFLRKRGCFFRGGRFEAKPRNLSSKKSPRIHTARRGFVDQKVIASLQYIFD
jgi:hypothetical protein